VQLPDVKRFGLDGRPNDGMKRLAFGQRTDGPRAVAQINKAVAVWHGRIFCGFLIYPGARIVLNPQRLDWLGKAAS
jgi:hypothetical protein